MPNIIAIYGSPRRKGNTAELTRQAVAGARAAGAEVEEVVLRDLKVSPCLEIYGCKKSGRCMIKDDFHGLVEKMLAADGLIISSPVFFYAVSAHLKTLMDRCQSLWVKKYWIETSPDTPPASIRPVLFISVGATKGKKLFDGILMSMRYFLDVLDAAIFKSLLYRGLDFEGDVLKHPAYLEEAHAAGMELTAKLTS